MNKKMKSQKNGKAKKPQFKYMRSLFTLFAGVVFLSGIAVFASKSGESFISYLKPSVKVNLTGTVSRDKGNVDFSKAGTVKPDEVLNWKIVSENDGDGEASSYKAVGQIPSGTEFIAGSASSEKAAVVKYSIDGGKNYSEKPMIKVKQADGSEKMQPASTSMYTQVRFEWEKPLESGEKLSAVYSTRVK